MKSKINRSYTNGKIKLQLWIITLLLSFIISSCDETEPPVDPLTVTTDTPTDITHTQAKLGGVVTKDGGRAVTARGVCVSLSANPTIDDPANDEVLNMGSGTGAFTDTFEGFPSSSTVHVRAFATNSSGTVYGEDKTFTTLAATAAMEVTTNTPSGITSTEAILGGSVTTNGGSTVTARGICLSLGVNPTIDGADDEVIVMGSGAGEFSNTITGLPPGTTIHVRAFATNSSETVYGADKAFTTLAAISALAVTTSTPEAITATEALLGGNVTNDGGSTVTARGVCISLTVNPTIDNPDNVVVVMGSGVGEFSNTIVDLPPGTTIHVRAYATNSTGTVYGEDKVFATLAQTGCPVVNVTASITTPTTWETGKVYMITDIINVSSTLTIEPGTVIKLNGGSIDIGVGGKIIANGTETDRIVFTSFADDNYCGDSNGDGTATTAQKGDWQMVYLNEGGSSFKYCDFLYGGKNRAGRNNVIEVSVAGPAFTFDHCTFAHTLSSSSSNAYAFFAQTYMNDHTTSVFTNNAFYDNDRPIFLDVNYTLNPNNIFHDPNDVNVTNARNGIFVTGGSIADGATVHWSVTEVPYVVATSCRAFSGSTLNIGPDVVVKFGASDSQLISTSSINLDATAFLTSYKDDVHGGDTNGDGSASSPSTGDWYGYSDTSTGFSVYINGPNILYASH